MAGEGQAGQMYLIVSSVPHLLSLHAHARTCVRCVCVCVRAVCVCVFPQECYESVIRVVTHLSNAPIPLGCHTL